MSPYTTKPLVIVRRDINGQTEVVLGSSWRRNWVRVSPGQELTVEGRLFTDCPKCGGHEGRQMEI